MLGFTPTRAIPRYTFGGHHVVVSGSLCRTRYRTDGPGTRWYYRYLVRPEDFARDLVGNIARTTREVRA